MNFGREDYDDSIKDVNGLIPEDEPVFLIRAQDPLGAYIVEAYASRAQTLGVDEKTVKSALAQALAMQKWGTKEGLPDIPKG